MKLWWYPSDIERRAMTLSKELLSCCKNQLLALWRPNLWRHTGKKPALNQGKMWKSGKSFIGKEEEKSKRFLSRQAFLLKAFRPIFLKNRHFITAKKKDTLGIPRPFEGKTLFGPGEFENYNLAKNLDGKTCIKSSIDNSRQHNKLLKQCKALGYGQSSWNGSDKYRRNSYFGTRE